MLFNTSVGTSAVGTASPGKRRPAFSCRLYYGSYCTLNWHMFYFYHFAWSYLIFSLRKYLSPFTLTYPSPFQVQHFEGFTEENGLLVYALILSIWIFTSFALSVFPSLIFRCLTGCKHCLEGRESKLQIWSFCCLVTDLTESFTRRKVSN